LYNRNENITAPIPQTTVTTSTVNVTDFQAVTAPITAGYYDEVPTTTTY
jgi:hypothetical protein